MANGEESGNETTTAEETVGQHPGGITEELEQLAADLAPEHADMTHEEPTTDPGIPPDEVWGMTVPFRQWPQPEHSDRVGSIQWTSDRAEPANGAYQYSPRGFSYEAKTKLEVMIDLMSCRPSPPKFHAVGLVMGMVLGAPAHFQFDKQGNYSLCQPLYVRIPFREFLSSATILDLFKLPYCVEDKSGTVDLFSLEHCPIVNVVYDDPVQNDQAALASSIGLILASDVVLFRHQRTFQNERRVDFNI